MRVATSLSSLGAAVRGARRDAGLTQLELADSAGVSRGTIIKIESGARFDVGGLLAVTRALRLDLALIPHEEPSSSILQETEEL